METRTYEDFYKFLGTRPERLGIVSSMYPELTASYLTEALRNVFYRDLKKADKFLSIDSMMFEWEVETNYIKRVELAATPEGDGCNGTSIFFAFKERYYEKYDTFRMDNTFEQFQVIARPVRKADNFWVCECRYITTDIKNGIDPEDYHAGDTTRFIANYHPELHEEGYVKYQSNMAKHRGYIGTHRVDDTYSALYKAMETQFISIGKGDSNGKLLSETIYKMDTVEKNLLKNFMEVRNRALLFGKSNVDANGKATIVDPNTNRPIYMYDGLIPQVERYASKYVYSELTVDAMQTAIGMMNQKAEKATGNKYAFICNEKAWMDVQNKLGAWLANFKPDGTFLWSKEANGYYSVGATYNSYNFGGNTITFIVDRTFSREFGNDKGYAMMIDLTADSTSGNPAVAMFTLKGGDFMYNKIAGVGGLDGLSSGVVSSTVAGSKLVNWGYASIAVFNPYRSFILRLC